MRINRKTLTAGLGAASLVGVGLYVAVPAAANPSPSPTSSSAAPEQKHGQKHGQNGRHRGKDGDHRGKNGQHRGKNGRWAARGFRGVHGEATVRGKDGFHLATWQRGQVTARSGATFTVRSADGTSWQWTTDAKTKVHKHGEKSAVSALAKDDQVVVFGNRTGDTRTAKMVRIPKK